MATKNKTATNRNFETTAIMKERFHFEGVSEYVTKPQIAADNGVAHIGSQIDEIINDETTPGQKAEDLVAYDESLIDVEPRIEFESQLREKLREQPVLLKMYRDLKEK